MTSADRREWDVFGVSFWWSKMLFIILFPDVRNKPFQLISILCDFLDAQLWEFMVGVLILKTFWAQQRRAFGFLSGAGAASRCLDGRQLQPSGFIPLPSVGAASRLCSR